MRSGRHPSQQGPVPNIYWNAVDFQQLREHSRRFVSLPEPDSVVLQGHCSYR